MTSRHAPSLRPHANSPQGHITSYTLAAAANSPPRPPSPALSYYAPSLNFSASWRPTNTTLSATAVYDLVRDTARGPAGTAPRDRADKLRPAPGAAQLQAATW